jgi:hypothetical protein
LSAEAIEIKRENSELRAEIEALLYINEEFGKEMEELRAERMPVTGESERRPVTEPIVVIEPYTIPQELATKESQGLATEGSRTTESSAEKSSAERSSAEKSSAEKSSGDSSGESSEESTDDSTDDSTELPGKSTDKRRIQPGRKAKEFNQEEETRVIF